MYDRVPWSSPVLYDILVFLFMMAMTLNDDPIVCIVQGVRFIEVETLLFLIFYMILSS